MVDAKAGAVNLAVIPYNWDLTYGSGRQIIFLDYNVVRTPGKPSIRLEPHTSADTNYACECDGPWYKCKPGDHIVAKVWIKTSTGTPAERAGIYDGARLGIDWYAPNSNNPGHVCIVGPEVTAAEHEAMMVRFGTSTWTLRTWDVIIPGTYYTEDIGTGNTINPVQITEFVIWVQLCHRPGSTAPTTEAWFADAELYIGPVPVFTCSICGAEFASQAELDAHVTSSNPPSVLPSQNVRIAVSSVTASSYSSGHPPSLAVDGVENPSNYWGTNALVPEGRVPQWLKLDLGSPLTIVAITTHFCDGDARTYTYYVEVSNDGSSWTRIVPTKTGSGSVTDTFAPVKARFVRTTIIANTANPAAHIEELKVYGSG